MMYPLQVGKFDLDFTTVGLVALAHGADSSLSQPLFGRMAIRYGTSGRWDDSRHPSPHDLDLSAIDHPSGTLGSRNHKIHHPFD